VRIFIISPVRNVSEPWRDGLLAYTHKLEMQGHKVYLPFRDTEQNDKTGFRICQDTEKAIFDADEIHIAYDGQSEGWLFDLGIAFAENKTIIPITGYFPPQDNKGKSYINMVWEWNARCFDY